MSRMSIVLLRVVVAILLSAEGVYSQVRPITPPVTPPIPPPVVPPISPPIKPPVTPPISPPVTQQPLPPVTPAPQPTIPSSGNPPPPALPRSYVMAVCLSDYDVTAGCLDKSLSETSEKLATMILKQYFKGIGVRLFRVVMPSSAPSVEQIQFLRNIEAQAIAIVKAKMLEDVRTLKAFWWETAAEKQRKQDVITEDARKATQEANQGTNWSHNWRNDRPSHDFHTGEAFRQLQSISISGWKGF